MKISAGDQIECINYLWFSVILLNLTHLLKPAPLHDLLRLLDNPEQHVLHVPDPLSQSLWPKFVSDLPFLFLPVLILIRHLQSTRLHLRNLLAMPFSYCCRSRKIPCFVQRCLKESPAAASTGTGFASFYAVVPNKLE